MDETPKRRSDDADALSPDDIAKKLNVSRLNVYRWIKAGHLKALRVGPKLYRIWREDYEAFLAQGGVPPLPEKPEKPLRRGKVK